MPHNPFMGSWSPSSGDSLPSSEDAKIDIEFLLTLVPGWARSPIQGLVLPGHTFEFELDIAARVKEIKTRWFPPEPPEVTEVETEII